MRLLTVLLMDQYIESLAFIKRSLKPSEERKLRSVHSGFEKTASGKSLHSAIPARVEEIFLRVCCLETDFM